ncbi:MAG: matrixin family metalloprotease, partial [Candidatus Marinimicrobia bacterium]|nr:matrixin family metalloprotease [Candidatus Neomarinimicrobiota bacterium]MCF7840121.1 matrixin family metalloprotease [Candidatus Neomarinimicrobiota bacterium]
GRNWDYPNVNVVVPEPSTTGMEDPLNFNSLKVSTISAMTNWNHVTGPGYIDFFAYNSSEESANILDFIYNSVAVIPTDSRLFFPIGYNSAAYFRYAVDDFNLSDDDDYMTFIYQNLNYANNNVNGDYQNSVIFLNGTGDIAWFNQYPPPDPSPPEYLPTHDVEAVITHEFGHILGLSHNNINGSLMSENGAARIVDDPVREAIGALYVIDVNSAVIYK